MKNENSLHVQWIHHWGWVSPAVIFHMLNEILFPRKIVTLGSIIFLLDFLLLFVMIQGILPASFELLFLFLLITIAGVYLWLIGYTC